MDVYELRVTRLPGHNISWRRQAVVRTANCVMLMFAVDWVRHNEGHALMGPAGRLGAVTEDMLARGQIIVDGVNEERERLREELQRRSHMRSRAPFN